MWGGAVAATDTNLITSAFTHWVFVGHLGGKGKAGGFSQSGAALTALTSTTSNFTDTTYASVGILTITAPTGGMA